MCTEKIVREKQRNTHTLSKGGKGNCTSLSSPNAARATAAANQLPSQLRETPTLRAVAMATRD